MPAIYVHVLAASNADKQALNLVDDVRQYGSFTSLGRLTPVIK